ncbi:MAG TPA: hypothetical protein PL167_14260 [Cyclobacteriaceae bacterium]|nr:hypothetical protein [Cyclobacteriaceae bacterium]
MKTFTTFALFLALASLSLVAQNPAKVNQDQLKPFSYMIGSWKGTASIQQQGGTSITVNQEEKISWQLDSLLINIEGIGRDPITNKKNFHAYAIIFYNSATQQVGMKSFTMEGRQTDAYFNVITENQFEWGFDLPNNRGKIKYQIALSAKDKTWNEKGEFSQDGTQWFPFMSMSLVKQ